MNASRTAQKEPPRQLTQNLLDPALAMHAGGAERRPSGLTDFGRGLDQVKASAVRLVPRLRAVASPLPAATRYGPSVDGVPFRTTGRHGIEDTANLRLPVHGSREKRHHCPTSKLRGGRESSSHVAGNSAHLFTFQPQQLPRRIEGHWAKCPIRGFVKPLLDAIIH